MSKTQVCRRRLEQFFTELLHILDRIFLGATGVVERMPKNELAQCIEAAKEAKLYAQALAAILVRVVCLGVQAQARLVESRARRKRLAQALNLRVVKGGKPDDEFRS